MLLALLLLQAPPAAAPCPSTPVPPPAELAGWTPMIDVAAAASPPVIPIGHGVRATLVPTTQVTLAAPTGHAKPDASAGVFAFDVAAAGRYRVALGAGAWVEVIAAGKPVASAAHGHGPACSPVRKMVDYDLQPGRYLVQLTDSPTATLPLMIARL